MRSIDLAFFISCNYQMSGIYTDVSPWGWKLCSKASLRWALLVLTVTRQPLGNIDAFLWAELCKSSWSCRDSLKGSSVGHPLKSTIQFSTSLHFTTLQLWLLITCSPPFSSPVESQYPSYPRHQHWIKCFFPWSVSQSAVSRCSSDIVVCSVNCSVNLV